MRFRYIAAIASMLCAPGAAVAAEEHGKMENHGQKGEFILHLRKERDSWLWNSPGNEIVWKILTDEARQAGKTKNKEKRLKLLTSAIEHASCFSAHDPRRHDTVRELQDCAAQSGEAVSEKEIDDLILPPPHKINPTHYRMVKTPSRAAYQPVNALIREADLWVVEGDTKKAVSTYRKILKSLSERPSRDGQEIVKVIDRLTRIYIREGRFTEAEELVRGELKFRESMHDRLHDFDPEKVQLAFLLGDLALTYSRQDRLVEAEAILKAALKIIERNLGDNHYDYIVTLGELARVHKEMGELGDAEKEYRTVISQSKGHPEMSNQARGVILGNYARLLKKMGKDRMASEFEAKANTLLAGVARPGGNEVAVGASTRIPGRSRSSCLP